ncbi:MAG: hypothetical protein SCH70_02275 [Candidatus Methanoperedens sp.]|nr:hypothetical protein [Candidatus Methanoperedens sp.]
MPDTDKIEEFLQKLAPCIECGEFEKCGAAAARLVKEMGIGAGDLLELSHAMNIDRKYDFVYVLGLAAAQGLSGKDKAKDEFKKAVHLDPLNTKARHNLRALSKIRLDIESEISQIQKYLSILISRSLIVLFISFFVYNRLSETVFAIEAISKIER